MGMKTGNTTALPLIEISSDFQRVAVLSNPESTSAIEEIIELEESPSILVSEQQFDIVTDKESLIFLTLTDIQEIGRGKFTNWKEDEHRGEKSLFEMRKRKPRV